MCEACISMTLNLVRSLHQPLGRARQVLQVFTFRRDQLHAHIESNLPISIQYPKSACVAEVERVPQGPGECHNLSVIQENDLSVQNGAYQATCIRR